MQTLRSDYILGHSAPELARLMHQAKLYSQISEHLLQLAGIAPGMRVLDVGCGPGDLTLLASRLVGPRGSVVGLDASADAVALARRRARDLRIDNTRFVVSDLRNSQSSGFQLASEQRYDAVIGRLVLMYLPDPGAVVKRLSSLVHLGGVMAFQEFDVSTSRCEPRCELYETTLERIKAAFAHRRLDLCFGAHQAQVFRAAGLPAPTMHQEVGLASAADADFDHFADVTRTLLPVMIAAGICTAEEAGVDTLAQRLREETVLREATLRGPALVGASTRVRAVA